MWDDTPLPLRTRLVSFQGGQDDLYQPGIGGKLVPGDPGLHLRLAAGIGPPEAIEVPVESIGGATFGGSFGRTFIGRPSPRTPYPGRVCVWIGR